MWLEARQPHWHASNTPPYALDDGLLIGAEEVFASLQNCPWLFPPASGKPPRDAPGGAGLAAGRAGGFAEPAPPEPPLTYDFAHLRNETAQSVVGILLAPSRGGAGGESLASQFGQALKQFAAQAHEVLTSSTSGVPLIPELERQQFIPEAQRAMKALVAAGRVRLEGDLVLCLEAFGVSKEHSAIEQDWQSRCVELMLSSALEEQEGAFERWKEAMRGRIRNESRELYSSIDVRSWPQILKLVGGDAELLEGEAFRLQVRLQLCMGGDSRKWLQGLKQAAELIAGLGKAESFGAEELCEIFNDRLHFERRQRQELLCAALAKAPRSVSMEVLRKIDGDDVELAERDDEEIRLVQELLQGLGEDIRCCKHTFFKMKSDWIERRERVRGGRSLGVVGGQELTPEQVADHIEDEDNHEELLKLAVAHYRRTDRKMEAAKMLARRPSVSTRVFETNKNDRELSYLITLYQEQEPPLDHFGPIEETCLVLGWGASDVLYVQDAGPDLAQLEQRFFGEGQPATVGIWWFWRCFDPRLDLWPRASIMVMAYSGGVAIVDFMKLESSTEQTEIKGKELVRRILEAPDLLKVVHGLDHFALQTLQHAAVPRSELAGDEPPAYPRISPVLDLAVVAAFVRRTKPSLAAAANLNALAFSYLRLELCLGEAMSNFERRPLRLTQQHYALTLAWCPLLILRALCAYGIIGFEELRRMIVQVGHAGAPPQWEDLVRRLSFGAGQAGEAAEGEGLPGGGVPGGYAQNLWEDPEWVRSLGRPDRNGDLGTCLRPLEPLAVPAELAGNAFNAAWELFDREAARRDLDSLCGAFHKYQQDIASTGQ